MAKTTFSCMTSNILSKLECYPNPKLLYTLPIPILEREDMDKIHTMVNEAYSKQYEANLKEKRAIKLVEKEIESVNKN